MLRKKSSNLIFAEKQFVFEALESDQAMISMQMRLQAHVRLVCFKMNHAWRHEKHQSWTFPPRYVMRIHTHVQQPPEHYLRLWSISWLEA